MASPGSRRDAAHRTAQSGGLGGRRVPRPTNLGHSGPPYWNQPQLGAILEVLGGREAVSQSEGHQQRQVHYEGRVQGVGFRYTVCRVAGTYSVTGYVRNLPDGRVLLVAEGAAEELDRFLAAVGTAMERYIRGVQQTTRPATGQFSDFGVRY